MKYHTTIWSQPVQSNNSHFSPSDRPIEYIRKDMYDAIFEAFIKLIEQNEKANS